MSDNLKRYRAIKKSLVQLHPSEPSGRILQSLCVLAMFINGIVASKSTHTRDVARTAPSKAKVTSREKQLSRWYQNERVTYAQHMGSLGFDSFGSQGVDKKKRSQPSRSSQIR